MWRNDAACLEEDPELFFPEGSGPAAMAQAEEAKAICRRCAVVDACLRWAIGVNLQYGVCGGMTPTERAALRGLRRPRQVVGPRTGAKPPTAVAGEGRFPN
jgi:WhiB family redox-sensing transcriptional regulator